ncbi:MAG: UDP-sugar hydrolase [Labilithrix sp.]|nr:UDP-sugar hydrolase [Labilithrix sp.]
MMRAAAPSLVVVGLALGLTVGGCDEPAPRAPSSRAAAGECLSIASWNDLHGQIAPEDAQVDANRVPAGGVLALADRLAEVRGTGDAVVALDAGDLFTGPIDSTLAEGAPIVDAYNVMGVDAVAIGNHEFDFGPAGYERVVAAPGATDATGEDGPRGALFARMAQAHFPFLSSNIGRLDGRPLGWKLLRRSALIRRGPWNVGVVGYSTSDTPLTTLKPNVEDLDFTTAAAAAVAAEVRALRAAGAAPVVLLAHASLSGVLPQTLDDPADPEGARRGGEIAALLDGMPKADRPDLVLGGHRHQWMLGRVRGIPIASSDSHGIGLTRTRFCRAGAGGAPRLDRVDRYVAAAGSSAMSPLGVAVREAVAPWQARVRALADAVVTTLPNACLDKALNGTALAEQTARALAQHVSAAGTPPPGMPVVALINTGGLRAPLGAGPLRYRDIFGTSPFENGVSVCVTTKAGVARTVATSVRAPEAHDRLTFGIEGAHVVLTRGADGGLDLKSLRIEDPSGRVTRDDDAVWLVVPDFVLWGGDALLDGVTCTRSLTSQLRVRDAWREVIAREQACDGAPKNVIIEAP